MSTFNTGGRGVPFPRVRAYGRPLSGSRRRSPLRPAGRALIVGAGRLRHGDDAAGIVIARWAARRLAGLADLLLDLDGWNTLGALEGHRLLVIVDAAEPSADFSAGSWLRMNIDPETDAFPGCGLRDTHMPGIDSMLSLARSLGRLPPLVWIYAIAGACFEPEARISPPVRAVALKVATRIEDDVRDWAASQEMNL